MKRVALLLFLVAAMTSRAALADDTPTPVIVTNSFTFPISTYYTGGCVSFKNISPQLVTAVRFTFVGINAFNETVLNGSADRLGEFASGVGIEGPRSVSDYQSTSAGSQKLANCWTFFLTKGAPTKVAVIVRKVVFADGTIWNATLSTAPQQIGH